MDFKIPYSNTKNAEEAYSKIKEKLVSDLKEKFKLDPEIEYLDNRMIAKGKGFKLDVLFSSDMVEGKIDLGFLLKPIKSKVVDTLERNIKRIV